MTKNCQKNYIQVVVKKSLRERYLNSSFIAGLHWIMVHSYRIQCSRFTETSFFLVQQKYSCLGKYGTQIYSNILVWSTHSLDRLKLILPMQILKGGTIYIQFLFNCQKIANSFLQSVVVIVMSRSHITPFTVLD